MSTEAICRNMFVTKPNTVGNLVRRFSGLRRGREVPDATISSGAGPKNNRLQIQNLFCLAFIAPRPTSSDRGRRHWQVVLVNRYWGSSVSSTAP